MELRESNPMITYLSAKSGGVITVARLRENRSEEGVGEARVARESRSYRLWHGAEALIVRRGGVRNIAVAGGYVELDERPVSDDVIVAQVGAQCDGTAHEDGAGGLDRGDFHLWTRRGQESVTRNLCGQERAC